MKYIDFVKLFTIPLAKMALRMLVVVIIGVLCKVSCSMNIRNVAADADLITDEDIAVDWLDYFNTNVAKRETKSTELSWNYQTNITDYNQQQYVNYQSDVTAFWTDAAKNGSMFNLSAFSYNVSRQLDILRHLGVFYNVGVQDNATLLEHNELSTNLKKRYSTGKVCRNEQDPEEECLSLDPDLVYILANSKDYNELAWVWQAWRDAVGAPAKSEYVRKVEINNQIAEANGYKDYGDFERSWYEVDNLAEQAENLYEQLRPLYENLHAYTRRKLYEVYGETYINLRGPIPAHLLGGMWSHTWSEIYDILEPFPGKLTVDITPMLQKQNYTALRIFQVADEFFTSLGLKEVPQSFWEDSMFEKPDDREVVCHASAWDFRNDKDVRIKMCTDINMNDFRTVHHEMGHIQYFLQYQNIPRLFKHGANPAFHEAIGDTLALSVVTPKHLHAIGLLDEVVEDEEADLNYLMRVAASKIAFLPYSYLLDQWRWGVFNGSITPDQYNSKWWEIRTRYQGIVPPVKRTEDDFDPAAKYHIAYDVWYIQYFLAYVTQFQFHKALCEEANHTGPLHRCDIYRSKQAGNKLARMLSMGMSRPWPDAMEVMTGQRDFDASALMEYFQPLTDWLIKQNELNGDITGWPETQWMPPEPSVASTFTFTSGTLLGCLAIIVIRNL